MKRYCGNNKPYIYVCFPAGKKEQALSVLEKLNASAEGHKINFWYSYTTTLSRKEIKRIEAAHALLAFADGGSLDDERFKETVNTATNNNRNVLCVHLEDFKYDTPWTKTQLGPQQAIKTRDYTDEASLVEKLKTAEILRDMRVTKEQKRALRRQLLTPVAAVVALALCVMGYLALMGKFDFLPEIPIFAQKEPEISILGIENPTQEYLDSITELIYIGGERLDGQFYTHPENGQSLPYDSETVYASPADKGRGTWKTDKFVYTPGKDKKLEVCFDFTDVEDWAYLQNNCMRMDAGTFNSLENIKYMRNLKKLTVIGNNIGDIIPVFSLRKLEVLVLDCNPIQSIEGIKALKNLKTLSLNYTYVEDITPVFGCKKLERFSVINTKVKSVEGISALKNLKEFYAARTEISNIEDLFNCEELRILDIGYSKIREMRALGNCHKLERLFADGSSLESVDSMDCACLNVLELRDIQTRDCSFLMPLQERVKKPLHRMSFNNVDKETLLPAIKDLKIYVLLWDGDGVSSVSELTCDLGAVNNLLLENSNELKNLEGIEKISKCVDGINLVGSPNIEDFSPLQSVPGFTDKKNLLIELEVNDDNQRKYIKKQLIDAGCTVVFYKSYDENGLYIGPRYVGKLH